MKTIVLIGLFLSIVIYQADCNHEHKKHKHIHRSVHGNQNEHGRRIRRQWSSANYRSYSPYDRQDFYTNREQQLMAEISSLLRQIKSNLSPQRQQTYRPVYVPYRYPVPVTVRRKIVSTPVKNIPALPNRNNFNEDEAYSRPISLKPVTEPPTIQTSSTEKVVESENAIIFPATPGNLKTDNPSVCEAAIITCCRFSEPKVKKACFSQYKCNKTYSTNLACKKEVLQTVVQKFIDMYAPK